MIIQGAQFSIRPVGEDDFNAVLDVYRQCEDFLSLTPTPAPSMDMVRADVTHSSENGGDFCGIYNPDGEMVGIVDVVLQGFGGDPKTAFIELLMIGRSHRGGGLGAAVVEAVEAEIKQDGAVDAIQTAVVVNNPAALRFWERQGYAKMGDAMPQQDGTVTWRLGKSVK